MDDRPPPATTVTPLMTMGRADHRNRPPPGLAITGEIDEATYPAL